MSQLNRRHLIPLVLAVAVFTLAAAPVSADWLLDSSGTLIKLDPILVLGDSVDSKREAAKKKLELQIEANQRKKSNTSEFELESTDSKLKIKQKTRLDNGRNQETQLELEDGEALQVQVEENSRVKVRSRGDALELSDATLSARTNLPLKVNEKNEITVTLPNGKTKEIAIPDKALSHLVEKGILTASSSAEFSYQLTAGKNGDPVYIVPDVEVEKKFLGFVPLKFRSTLEVAADDSGEIVSSTSSESNPFRRFLERLSR